jgi:four helix bundle protein
MHDFKKLRVWQEARTLGAEIHALTRTFPRSDRGIVASQLRRSALGIAATIAEGCGKDSRAETVR